MRYLSATLLGAMEVERVAHLSGDLANAVLEHAARVGVDARLIGFRQWQLRRGRRLQGDISEKLMASSFASVTP